MRCKWSKEKDGLKTKIDGLVKTIQYLVAHNVDLLANVRDLTLAEDASRKDGLRRDLEFNPTDSTAWTKEDVKKNEADIIIVKQVIHEVASTDTINE